MRFDFISTSVYKAEIMVPIYRWERAIERSSDVLQGPSLSFF